MTVIATFAAAYLVLLGFMLGSFINLAADRVPRGESLLRPGSHCRACGRRLNVVDLFPVLGYLLRGGRCATCRAPIGASVPVVEAASGLLMLAPLAWLGLWPGALVGAGLIALWGCTAVGFAMRRKEGRTLG